MRNTYSRSFYNDQTEKISLPKNYDGTAFSESPDITESHPNEEASEPHNLDLPASANLTEGGVSSASLIGNIPFLSGLFNKEGILGGLGLKMPRIGNEEILILATAAFLFFSKGGDRECALILLLLLFIN